MATSEGPVQLPDGMPFTLTVTEAAKALRISRGAAYELVHRWIATDGAEGLPIVALGLDRTWRVPTVAVLRLVGVLDAPTAQPETAMLRSLHGRQKPGRGAA